MNLPNGVTGFYDSDANKPPQINGKQFKQLCFEFATMNGGKVIDFHTPQHTANFYYAQVDISGNHVYILLNAHYPYLAFASHVEIGTIQFIDKPVFCENFSEFYQVLGKNALNAPINQNLAKELNNAEWKQIAYWKPVTVGEIIFNYWD